MRLSIDLAIGGAVSSRRRGWSPADLFDAGQDGVWLDATRTDAAFQDFAGNIPAVADGDPVGRLADLSGNGRHATQTATERLSLAVSGDARWGVRNNPTIDTLEVTVPAGGWNGTMVLGTREGIVVVGVTIPAGTWSLAKNGGAYYPGDTLVGLVIRDGALSPAERSAMCSHLRAQGAGRSFAGTANLSSYFERWDEITSVNLADWDLSGATNMIRLFRGTGLTALDLSGRDLGSVDLFNGMCWQCTSLTSVDAAGLRVAADADFTLAFTGCALDQPSVDGLLAALDASGLSNRTVGLDGGLSAPPSPTGMTHVDNLRARGCTIMLNGGS